MHPILFRIGSFPIHTYGVLIALGFLLCVAWARLEAIRERIDEEKMIDLGFWSLLVGMVGSRILFVLTRLDYFSQRPLEIFYVWEGGLVFFGGPLLCIPFFFWYTKKHRLPRWKVLDIAAQCVPLAHAFGRLGCLSAGCCHGKPTSLSFGVRLHSELVEPQLRGIPLHPTQLYESFSLFILFFVFVALRRKKAFDGQLAFLYLIFYSIIRSVIEIFRGDRIRGFIIDEILSTSQFISILVIIGAGVGMWRLWKRKSSLS